MGLGNFCKTLRTLSLSNASLAGFVDRTTGGEGVGGGVSAIVSLDGAVVGAIDD